MKKHVLTGIAGILLGALSAYAFATKGANDKRKDSEEGELPEGFVWIDGMDLEDSDDLPYFDEGESVIIRSPYSNGVWEGNLDMDAPVIFEVLGARYDHDDLEWRYKLRPRDVSEEECGLSFDLNTEWVAESWLDFASKASLYRKMFSVGDKAKTIPMTEVVKGVQDLREKKTVEIDYWLDTLLHSSDVEERKHAEERLAELAEKKTEEDE